MKKRVYISCRNEQEITDALIAFAKEFFGDCEIVNPNEIMTPELDKPEVVGVRLSILRTCSAILLEADYPLNGILIAEKYVAKAMGLDLMVMSAKYQENLLVKNKATTDVDDNPLFTCPNCGRKLIAGILKDAEISMPVKFIEEDSVPEVVSVGLQWDTGSVVVNGGEIKEFRCNHCWNIIYTGDKKSVKSIITLNKILKEGNYRVNGKSYTGLCNPNV